MKNNQKDPMVTGNQSQSKQNPNQQNEAKLGKSVHETQTPRASDVSEKQQHQAKHTDKQAQQSAKDQEGKTPNAGHQNKH
ncbi:MAG: hypothetical protein ABI388_06295 [Bacteroidia bacterium]